MKDFTKLPETTLKAIGEKHEPYSIKLAIKKANPNYSPSSDSYSMNCQRCVLAYELLRRGYNVQAKTYKGNKDRYLYLWSLAFGKAEKCPVANMREISEWTRRHSDNGCGRYIVHIAWDEGGAHVFNLELRNNRLISADAQVHKMSVLKKYVTRRDTDGYMLIYRTDNVKFNRKIYGVIKRGTKDYE